MTVTIHPRETGATIRCDYHGCPRILTTGQILIRPIREYASTLGWIRGLDPGSGGPNDENGRPSNLKHDICPVHAVDERRNRDKRNAASNARRARRDELHKMSLEERLQETRRVRNAAAKARRKRKRQLAEMLPTVAA